MDIATTTSLSFFSSRYSCPSLGGFQRQTADFPAPPFLQTPSPLRLLFCEKIPLLPISTGRLPLHLVGLVALPEGEGGGEVAGEELDLLDAGDQGLVDGLLVLDAVLADLLLL